MDPDHPDAAAGKRARSSVRCSGAGLPVESVTGAEALDSGDVPDALRRAVGGSSH